MYNVLQHKNKERKKELELYRLLVVVRELYGKVSNLINIIHSSPASIWKSLFFLVNPKKVTLAM